MTNHEIFENVVASIVDLASIMIAYTIGATQSSFFVGVGYAIFDAVVVVWLRKPISNALRVALTLVRRPSIPRDAYAADVA